MLPKYTKHLAQVALELGALHVPIVPISVKDPVAASMLYIEMLFEPEFVPKANLPEGWIVIEPGEDPVPVVPANVKAPPVVSIAYIETPLELVT